MTKNTTAQPKKKKKPNKMKSKISNSKKIKSKQIKPKNIKSKKISKVEAGNKRASLKFKLKLIPEIKKHNIIWENEDESKNKSLLLNAWNQVRKTCTSRFDVKYCQRQWKLLKNGYRNHINVNKPMRDELVGAMSFMEAQLKYPPTEDQSKDEPVNSKPNPVVKAETPKAQQVQISNTSAKVIDTNTTSLLHKTVTSSQNGVPQMSQLCRKEATSEDKAVSLAILEHLFVKVRDDAMPDIRDNLVQVLINLQPELKERVVTHAIKQLVVTRDCKKIDWTELKEPTTICQALWFFHLNKNLKGRL